MARFLCTICALLLNLCGLTIFPTCFADATEDEDGKSLLDGSPISYILFAAGVHTIVTANTLFPQSFRKPYPAFLCIYEFLVTAFFLEFATACIWTPIDVLLVKTLSATICNISSKLGLHEESKILLNNKSLTQTLTITTSATFFALTLHVTKSVDFTVLTECGPRHFADYLKTKVTRKIFSELPKMPRTGRCRCRMRRRSGSKSRNDRRS